MIKGKKTAKKLVILKSKENSVSRKKECSVLSEEGGRSGDCRLEIFFVVFSNQRSLVI